MDYRILGNTDLRTSILGFGCNLIGQSEVLQDRRAIEATLRQGLDQGINLLDTADIYSQGESERILGSIISDIRDQVIICSKAGFLPKPKRSTSEKINSATKKALSRWESLYNLGRLAHQRILNRVGDSTNTKNFAPHYLRNAIEGSLKRLGTDYLDIFLLHSPPVSLAADEAVWDMLADIKAKGIIRHYGVSMSNFGSTQDAVAWLKIPDISILQILINPLRAINIDIIGPLARERGVGIIGRQPFDKGSIISNPSLREFMEESLRCTVAQAALRFAMHSPDVSSVLVGMRSQQHLNENLESLSLPPMTTEELALVKKVTTVY